jgi:two-component system response regulator AtoC
MPFDDSTARRLDDDGAPLALLVVGDATVQSVALPARGAVVLGRARDCDVTIADESVSRRHARLHVAPLRLEDLGSANGTRVGDRTLKGGEAMDLAAGGAFALGSVTVFVQRARSHASGFEVRTDGYFEARLATECARAVKFALRFAVVVFAADGCASELDAAVRGETRGGDVVSITSRGEVRVLLLHATRGVADSFADRVCARVGAGACEIGVAACPDDGVDPGRLLAATRTHARTRICGALHGDTLDPVAEDAVSLALKARVSRLAANDLPVLFVGEEGTGKSTWAAWAHAQSKRARRPLIRVACETMSAAQLESALFGEGDGERSGAIEAADGGSLLLEHAEALPASLEARLAHVLEYAQTYRVRSTTPRRVRVRVLATARRRIDSEMLRRLASVVVEVPPLRARRDDIAPLARRFVAASCATFNRAAVELTPGALDTLRDHAWPGNARALRIAVDRAVASTDAPRLEAATLELPSASHEPSALHEDVQNLERERITSALAAHGGNRSRAARALGIARNTLLARLRAYGVG